MVVLIAVVAVVVGLNRLGKGIPMVVVVYDVIMLLLSCHRSKVIWLASTFPPPPPHTRLSVCVCVPVSVSLSLALCMYIHPVCVPRGK